ncbi:hypothetical protein BGX28_006289 [Mortierella sp. GBA30]|nr:hypothetical protein BGX28_006289 [Mortierella sp. GBA30]
MTRATDSPNSPSELNTQPERKNLLVPKSMPYATWVTISATGTAIENVDNDGENEEEEEEIEVDELEEDKEETSAIATRKSARLGTKSAASKLNKGLPSYIDMIVAGIKNDMNPAGTSRFFLKNYIHETYNVDYISMEANFNEALKIGRKLSVFRPTNGNYSRFSLVKKARVFKVPRSSKSTVAAASSASKPKTPKVKKVNLKKTASAVDAKVRKGRSTLATKSTDAKSVRTKPAAAKSTTSKSTATKSATRKKSATNNGNYAAKPKAKTRGRPKMGVAPKAPSTDKTKKAKSGVTKTNSKRKIDELGDDEGDDTDKGKAKITRHYNRRLSAQPAPTKIPKPVCKRA